MIRKRDKYIDYLERRIGELEEKLAEAKEAQYPKEQQLNDHIKCICERIMNDAEMLISDPKKTSEITIEAGIKPETDVTTVTYTIVKYADPRIKKGES